MVRRLAGATTVAVAVALCLPPAGGASFNCGLGRSLLRCGEKQALYADSVSWAVGGALDLTLFGSRLPFHLNNPALAKFWQFEAATAVSRYEFEFATLNQLVDPDFEAIAQPTTLPPPLVVAHGIVNRGMAAAMSRLMLAEQQEVVNLGAFFTAMNRATAALTERSRPDWVAWQQSAAAGFAHHAASAIGRVIRGQRAVTHAFVRSRLRFGVGPVDLRLAQRRVRAHGFTAGVTQIMSSLGITPILLAYERTTFLTAGPLPTSYSLSDYLSSSTVITDEKNCALALRQYAARIPAAGRPPS